MDNVHIALIEVHVRDAVCFVEKMANISPQLLSIWIPSQDFQSSEDNGADKWGMTVGDMIVFDLETILPRLLMVRQNLAAAGIHLPTWLVHHSCLAHRREWLLTEGEQIYPCHSSRIETSLCPCSRYCHSGYATDTLSLCLATWRGRLWPQWKYQVPSILLLYWYRAGFSLR